VEEDDQLQDKMIRYAVAILLLTSCSANWHLKRAIKKDPSLLNSRDTVLVHDTQIVTQERVLTDSFVTTCYDTITLEDSFVYTQVIRKDNVIKIYTKCKSDTVRITTKIPFSLPPTVSYKNDPFWKSLAVGLGTLLLLIIILRFVLK
jgi:hypothetical protein